MIRRIRRKFIAIAVLVLTLAITKKILEAIINWIRKKRSEAFLKKQANN